MTHLICTQGPFYYLVSQTAPFHSQTFIPRNGKLTITWVMGITYVLLSLNRNLVISLEYNRFVNSVCRFDRCPELRINHVITYLAEN